MSLKSLFQPKWKHPNPEKRKKAVSKITDQSLLAQIVKTDINGNVKLVALENISVPSLLADIGINYGVTSIATAAIKKIDDIATVIKALNSAKNVSTRIAALHHLWGLQIDKEELTKIIHETAIKAKNEGLRGAAIEYSEDPAILREVALNDSYIMNKAKAAIKLKDEEHLAVLLRDESNKVGYRINIGTCKVILDHISDEHILTKIAKTNPFFELRRIAEEKVKEQTLQQEITISKRERYTNYDLSKVMKIDDPYHALDIALYGTKRDIRSKAIDMIYFKYKAGKVTLTVKRMPSDIRSKLEEIARNNDDKAIKDYASGTLDRLDGKY